MKTPMNAQHAHRIWITGLGAWTPLGEDVPTTWGNLLAGHDGIRPIQRIDLGGIACTHGGEVALPPPVEGFRQDPLMQDPAARFAWQAGQEALAGRCAVAGSDAMGRTGLALATNFGCAVALEPLLQQARMPEAVPAALPSGRSAGQGALADRLAAAWRLDGPRGVVSLSCSAGAAALAWAAGLIRQGRTDRMLVIGTDALSPFAWYGLCALRTMTRDRIRPFDLNRSGTLFSEGAAALLLESETAARQRDGQPLAILRGWAVNNNAHHLTAPAPRGAGTARVLRAALADAGLPPEAVEHYNAHATATQPNDRTEAEAMQDVFGPRAAQIPVAALKSSLGHMLGAAGAIEALATVLTLREGCIPPALNVETLDPACPVDLVRDQPRELRIRTAISNSAGIGGNNAALVLSLP